MSDVIARARADLDRGEPWRARDRLTAAFKADPSRADVADLLGDVHATMGDLPAAGRWWMLTEDDDERHEAARRAFAERHGRRGAALRAHVARAGEDFPLGPRARARLEAIGWSARADRPSSHAQGWAPEGEGESTSLLGKAATAAGVIFVLLATVGVWFYGVVRLFGGAG